MDAVIPPVMDYAGQQGMVQYALAHAANMGVLPDGTPPELVDAYRKAIQGASDAASGAIQTRADWGDMFAPMLAFTKTAFSGGGHTMA